MRDLKTIPLLNIITIFLLVLLAYPGFAQEDDAYYDQMLRRVDTIENPVYKPFISLGYGSMNFFGDVKNKHRLPVIGNPAGKVMLSTFIDNQHYYTLSFYFLGGNLYGEQRSFTEPDKNLNFTSSIYSIGVSGRYQFDHFVPVNYPLRPYFAAGIEQINFSTKGDIFDANGTLYQYWPDGTIRDIPYGTVGVANEISRDYNFETDLRSYEEETYRLGEYSSRSFALPLEVGFIFNISDRIFFDLGIAYHYTFTDFLDNVAVEGTHYQGKKGKDAFLMTQATLHFDMFSDPTTRTIDLLYADLELDPIFYGDEDGDFILDIADHCPGTPYGVLVDTLGCPLDIDQDGVPDYLDKENDTPEGSWVDDNGVSLSEEDFIAKLNRDSALNRDDLEAYMELFRSTFQERAVTEIPEKFVVLDTDGDGYISFDELLRVIDDYFDFKVNLSLEELREVNEFFFSQ